MGPQVTVMLGERNSTIESGDATKAERKRYSGESGMRSLLTNILLCWIFPSVYALITPPPQNILKCDSLFKNYFRAYGFINIYKGHYGCNLYFLYKPGEMSLDKDAT